MKSQAPPVPSVPGNRKVAWATAILFLGFCAGVPLVQAVREIIVQKRVPLVADLFRKIPSKEGLHGWDAAQRDNSWLAERIRDPLLQWRWTMFRDAGSKAIPGVGDWLFYAPDVQYLARPDARDPRLLRGSAFDTLFKGHRVYLNDPRVAILDFRDQLRARGIELLVVPVPTKASIHPERLNPAIETPSPSPTLKLIEDLRASHVAVVDLFSPMLAARGKALYLRQDTHWEPAGLGVAVPVIAAAVQEKLSGKSAASPWTLRDTVISRWGDIAEMTKLPERRKIWPEQRLVIPRVVDASGRGYRDADTARVLWLGDSYSRIYQTDAPGSAGVISRVAQLLGEPLKSIVNDGGASTKVREQLAHGPEMLKGVKVVVWEFVERDIRFGDGGWKPVELPQTH